MLESVVISASLLIFSGLAIILTYKKLTKTLKEYETSKSVVKGIVITFKNRQHKLEERMKGLATSIEEVDQGVGRLTNRMEELEERVESIIGNLEEYSLKDSKIHNYLSTLKEGQAELNRKLVTVKNAIKRKTSKSIEVTLGFEGQTLDKLTPTEKQILRTLFKDGPKTSRYVEKKIGKTREHTARLMKKLWREGYIERNTLKMPFVYSPTSELKRIWVES